MNVGVAAVVFRVRYSGHRVKRAIGFRNEKTETRKERAGVRMTGDEPTTMVAMPIV
jgi:hypothetical protein